MLFVQVVIRNLAGRKVHAALTIFTLAIAVAATILLFGAAWGFADAATASLEGRGVDVVITRSGVVERANSSLRADQAHILSKLPGVVAVDGTLQETVSLKTKGFADHPHLLLGQDPRGFSLKSLQIQAGQTLAAEDRVCVLIGVGLAASLTEKLNESIEIEGRKFRIAGIFLSENPVETNLLIAPLADVQELMDRPGQVTQFEVQVDKSHANADAIRALCQQIEGLRDDADQSLGLQALPVREFVGSGTRNRLATAMAWGTTSIAMVLASLGILNTLLVSVQERTREIGVLRALGWPRMRVLRMILLESFALGLLAIVSGAVLAVFTAVIIARFPAIREITGPLITWQALLCGAVPAAVAILLGGFYPAWHAASIPATEALRYE
jgi:putative ABC transport system permease protein